MKAKIEDTLNIPTGVTVTSEKGIITVKGPKGEVSKNLFYPDINFDISNSEFKIVCDMGTKREKKIVRTYVAHLNNMMKGVNEPFVYQLKICSGHFPMSASVSGQEFILKNFIGESKPRKLKLKAGAKVEVAGAEITVTSPNKETAGQVAADLEKLTKRANFDNRIFQDGIYIVSKDGKEM